MQFLKEQIKPIKDYEGLYSISNYGYAIALSKEWIIGTGGIRKKEEMTLKTGLSGDYPNITLCKNGKLKTFTLHSLVWDHFGDSQRDGRKLQIDHKNGDKLNPRIDNLQLLTQRQNSIKYRKTQKHKTSSKYIGVHWCNRDKSWIAQIQINGKPKYLGYFANEICASNEYQRALKEFNNISTTRAAGRGVLFP